MTKKICLNNKKTKKDGLIVLFIWTISFVEETIEQLIKKAEKLLK